MSENALNFILEFTNWKRLPLAVEQDLSDREKFTWTPKSHFGKQYNWEKKVSVCQLSGCKWETAS